MNKYNIAAQAFKIIIVCILAITVPTLVIVVYRVFSPPEPVAEASQVEAPARIDTCSARFYSTIEKQRIMRNERIYKGPIDGKRGDLTIAAEKEHAKLYNDWCNRQEMK